MLITTGNLCFDSGGMVKSFPRCCCEEFSHILRDDSGLSLSQQTGHTRVISIYVVRKWAILFLVDACSLLIPPKRSAPEHLPERWYFRAAQLRLLWVITECIFQFLIINFVQTAAVSFLMNSNHKVGRATTAWLYLPALQQIYVKGLICTPNTRT